MINNKETKYYVTLVRKKASIKEIMKEDGVELHDGGGQELIGYHSNKHGSDSKESLRVNIEKGIYHCFNCGEGGNVYTWLMKNRGMTFLEAFLYLAKRYDIELPEEMQEEVKKYGEYLAERKELENLYLAAATIWHEQVEDRHYNLLDKQWGLKRETADQYLFGYAPVESRFIESKLIAKGFSPELIYRSGLINEVTNERNEKKRYDFFVGRLVFPYWKNGNVVYFAGRQTDETPNLPWETSKYKKMLTHSKEHSFVSPAVSNNYFVGEDSVIGASEVIITEGICDCYAALQAGLACISPGTTQFRDSDINQLQKIAKNLKKTFICNDNEASLAGFKGAKKTAEILQSVGVIPKIIILPLKPGQQKIDLAEFLRDNASEAFRKQIAEARTLFELARDEFAANPNDTEKRQQAIELVKAMNPVDKSAALSSLYKYLKPFGVTKKALQEECKQDVTYKQTDTSNKKKSPNQADLILKMVKAKVYLFKDEFKTGFAQIKCGDHYEIWPVRNSNFKHWVMLWYHEEYGNIPPKEAVNQAIEMIEAQCAHKGQQYTLNPRVGKEENTIWYDLANEKWQAIRIDDKGWQIAEPPILFAKYANTAPQVTPTKQGDIKRLLEFINLKSAEDEMLLLVYVVTALIPGIPHAIPIIHGSKGASKTYSMKTLRAIIDPARQPMLHLPHDVMELGITLMKNHTPCFDNLDSLSAEQSDMLCTAVTGGGFSKRMLYTDAEEVIIKFHRCPIINGINIVARRDDLLDRAILFNLERIEPEKRLDEETLWRNFEAARPEILAGMFQTLSKTLAIYPTVALSRLPRMADFCKWGYAAAEALGYGGKAFLEAYYANINQANEEAVNADQVSTAVVALMRNNPGSVWTGSPSQLLQALCNIEGIDIRAKDWPKAANVLTRKLNKAKSGLQDYGYRLEVSKSGNRAIRISGNISSEPTIPSQPNSINGHDAGGIVESVQNQDDIDILEIIQMINEASRIYSDKINSKVIKPGDVRNIRAII